MAEILEGLLLINQTDVYARFGAFLAETAEDRHDNYDSLLAPPALKQQAEVSIREEDGVRMPDILTQTYEARDITLRFAIVASNDVSFFMRYASFVKFLKEGDDGWLALHLTDVGLKFRVYMTGFSDYSQLAPFGKGEVAEADIRTRCVDLKVTFKSSKNGTQNIFERRESEADGLSR